MLVAQNPYDSSSSAKPAEKPVADANNNDSAASPVDSIIANTQLVPASTSATVWVEPPSPALQDFKPFDLESWWGRRLFQNITKSL